MKNNLFLIIQREYYERVKRKSFIITTILMPIFMVAMMVLPGIIAVMAGPEEKKIAVVDESGVIAKALHSDGDEITFVPFTGSADEAKADEDFDAVLVIGADVVSKPSDVALFTHSASSVQTEAFIRGQLESAIEDIRLRGYDIDNLAQIIREVKPDVQLSSYRIDASSEETATSSMLSYFVGLAMMFMLYMFILMYGQMVMTSVVEEKNNRVLEVMVSSVKPTDLMIGKIGGMGLVAITQILIWGVLMVACSMWVMPLLAGKAAAIDDDPSLIQALSQLGDPGYIMMLFGTAVAFLIGGYLLYSSIFAAIGSAVDNIQDASQLTSVAMVPIILSIMLAMVAINDSNSSLAVWFSIIPITSPIVMMVRVPFGIPGWQILVSLVILYITFVGMIWLSAKIYRVGIFMYGKKPSLAELMRWARYK